MTALVCMFCGLFRNIGLRSWLTRVVAPDVKPCVLASELRTPIDAVDSYQPFLNRLKWRAEEKGLAHLVQHALHGYERHSECLSNKRSALGGRRSLQHRFCKRIGTPGQRRLNRTVLR